MVPVKPHRTCHDSVIIPSTRFHPKICRRPFYTTWLISQCVITEIKAISRAGMIDLQSSIWNVTFWIIMTELIFFWELFLTDRGIFWWMITNTCFGNFIFYDLWCATRAVTSSSLCVYFKLHENKTENRTEWRDYKVFVCCVPLNHRT